MEETITQRLPPGEEVLHTFSSPPFKLPIRNFRNSAIIYDSFQKEEPGHHIKRVEFLTAVGKLDESEQALYPPPDQHTQMLESQ